MTNKLYSKQKKIALVCVTAVLCLGAMWGCTLRDAEKAPSSDETDPPHENFTETNAPAANVPETKAPETDIPETKAPETMSPGTSTSDTDVADTEAAETDPVVLVSEIRLPFSSVQLQTGGTITPAASIAPLDAENRDLIWVSSDPAVAQVDNAGVITAWGKGTCVVTVSAAGNSLVRAEIAVTVEEAPSATYIDGILIANKTYALPSDYAPGIDAEAYNKLLTMMNDAANQGISLWLVSGYRSYWDQNTIYNNYVTRDGQAAADRYSARPGHSEHQTGLAFDLNSLYQSFGDTAEGIWLAENCHRYGFIIRYPQDKEHITGYMYEPWHIRYVGDEAAVKIKESGLCVEEFFGITSAY